jgi:hypothetical protein
MCLPNNSVEGALNAPSRGVEVKAPLIPLDQVEFLKLGVDYVHTFRERKLLGIYDQIGAQRLLPPRKD